MPGRNGRKETLIGAVVVLAGGLLLALTTINRYEGEAPAGVYEVRAVFNRADGVGVGSEVRLAGIPVGKVVAHTLADTYRAEVTMRLDIPQELPDDTSAAIQTEGLLGSKYIELLTGGGGFGTIGSGERLDYTQDSVVIEDLMSKVVALAKTRRGLDPNRPAAEQVREHDAEARRKAQENRAAREQAEAERRAREQQAREAAEAETRRCAAAVHDWQACLARERTQAESAGTGWFLSPSHPVAWNGLRLAGVPRARPLSWALPPGQATALPSSDTPPDTPKDN
ncbi:MlaD family protein [Pararhodospirillum oryzae]|uniref:Mce/MlaD domain-containing protein n=1 Tax=Pararhodospirillum oryzae TaxID=478448 RepID=A0A512H6Y9_9PROT|nr:MlaD family protein [Pararhodospirillum oryzae]GEO81229.1 hypothetical protein ROR02_13600 [Pararhodospirillum oryzae]